MSKNVFINCPFDETFDPLKYSILFTVVSLNYEPRLSTERDNAKENRLDKIVKLIEESNISIHDLSKIKASKKDEFFRMNMPFELGLDFGCSSFSSESCHNKKKIMILGGEKYEYMKALSDISGIDIQYHNNDKNKIIESIRNWFVNNEKIINAPSPSEIWYKLCDFHEYYSQKLISKGYTLNDVYKIPIFEQITYMKQFLIDEPYNY